MAAACTPGASGSVSLTAYKQLILDAFNKKRNMITTGEVKHLPIAGCMGTMVRLMDFSTSLNYNRFFPINFKICFPQCFQQYDDELAYLAELNTKQCKMAHDTCRNTGKAICL